MISTLFVVRIEQDLRVSGWVLNTISADFAVAFLAGLNVVGEFSSAGYFFS